MESFSLVTYNGQKTVTSWTLWLGHADYSRRTAGLKCWLCQWWWRWWSWVHHWISIYLLGFLFI